MSNYDDSMISEQIMASFSNLLKANLEPLAKKIDDIKDEITNMNRKFEDERKWNDTRFARMNMHAQMDGGSYKSVPLVPTGHALSESSKDYRRVKSQGR